MKLVKQKNLAMFRLKQGAQGIEYEVVMIVSHRLRSVATTARVPRMFNINVKAPSASQSVKCKQDSGNNNHTALIWNADDKCDQELEGMCKSQQQVKK